MKKILLSLVVLFAGISLSAQTVTISEIQGQADASPYQSQIVTTSGIVTAHIRDYGFFLQDGEGGWNGIYVYHGDSAVVNGLNRGDELEITAMVDEYFGKTELVDVASMTVLSTGNPLPGPMAVSTADINNDEQYEGVYVRVTDAVVTDTTLGYGEIMIDDGSDTCRVDDKLWSFWFDVTPIPDSAYNITGIVDFSYATFKLLPRDEDDFVSASTGIADNERFALEIYPNPVSNGKINLTSGKMIESVELYNMVGQSVFNQNNIGRFSHVVKAEGLRNGVYILKLSTTDGAQATRRIMID
ncbi:MAG TPA: T9SS type A sorting domain-containing protein [Bacteroidales bacterium]|nr:T9SS type A sorting domain-containing protein [Bacteroidales bacterium]